MLSKVFKIIGLYRNLLKFANNNFKFYSKKRYPNDSPRHQLAKNLRKMDQRRT